MNKLVRNPLYVTLTVLILIATGCSGQPGSSEHTACRTNLRQIYREISLDYVVDNEGVYPPEGYQITPSLCPVVTPSIAARYLYNSALAGRLAEDIPNELLSKTPLVYEDGFNHQNKRRVLFLNGEVRDLTQKEWKVTEARYLRPMAGGRP